MRRLTIEPRENWQGKVESQGLHFHTVDDRVYWDESACYAFGRDEIDLLEKATYALDGMCLEAVEHVFQNDLFDDFEIPERFRDWLWQSWQTDERTIYGRFDLAYRPGQPPKMLEYNADTPTGLLEAAVVQWYWLKDTGLGIDQFNGIHERLIEAWKAASTETIGTCCFSSVRDHVEDFMTVNYLRDTAIQAGLQTEYIAVEDIAWNSQLQEFVDGDERPLPCIFKLYPWEWMLAEEFGPNLPIGSTRWLEPPWKMILSNKAILPVLWKMFPESPYLLRSEFEPFGSSYVAKPIHGREGANVQIVENGQTTSQVDGPYDGRQVFQEVHPLPDFDGNRAIIGSWMVNGYACGMGIREDTNPITQNTSRFVPHFLE